MSIARARFASPLLLAMSCASSLQSFATTDEAAVYATVIESAFKRKDGGRLYIDGELKSYLYRPVDHDLWPALESARDQGGSVPSEPPLSAPYSVLAPSVVQAAFEPAGWSSWFHAYPDSDGLIHCSAIGYDPMHRRALVVIGVSSGRNRGWGATFYLEKRDARWQVVKRVQEYIV